ncbi:hypothetical protein K435DRAFT_867140 [Dendrothele bispora CBS 962.96]|uniref:Uncharacterized protein n=1 Tax=Dendrothele bispora (strain CBS 962.96) TaxID=1314807 RepID=A0A4V4HDK7_DENBC|nr:hypothetical protein K435DRAFT_867140 [Dendrothele bispora CBS 962.96]
MYLTALRFPCFLVSDLDAVHAVYLSGVKYSTLTEGMTPNFSRQLESVSRERTLSLPISRHSYIPSLILAQVSSSSPRLIPLSRPYHQHGAYLQISTFIKSVQQITQIVHANDHCSPALLPFLKSLLCYFALLSSSVIKLHRQSPSTMSNRYRSTRRSDALARWGVGSKKNFMRISDDKEEFEEDNIDGDDEYRLDSSESSDDRFVDLPIDFSSSFRFT